MLNHKNTKKMNAELEKKLIENMEVVSCINEKVELYNNDIYNIKGKYNVPVATFINNEHHYYAIWFKTIRLKNNIVTMFSKEEIIKAAFIKSLQ